MRFVCMCVTLCVRVCVSFILTHDLRTKTVIGTNPRRERRSYFLNPSSINANAIPPCDNLITTRTAT